MMELDFTSEFKIIELQVWMDGGSLTARCVNDLNQKIDIEIVQNVVWEFLDSQKIPGRLYVNNELVGQRSEFEKNILNALRNSEKKTLSAIDKKNLAQKIEYIESDQFLTDCNKPRKYIRNST